MSGESSLAQIVDGEASESDDDTITSGHSSPERRLNKNPRMTSVHES